MASLGKDEIKKQELDSMLKKLDAVDLKHEFSEKGTGSDLWRFLEMAGKLSVAELIKWVHV